MILGVNILLWFLATYPKSPAIEKEYAMKSEKVRAESFHEWLGPGPPPKNAVAPDPEALLRQLKTEEAGAKLRSSFAGRMGRAIEPVIAPLGFDWKIGIGIISSFAAREVFVSTMSTVYNVGNADESESDRRALAQTLRMQTRPDGTPLYTPLLAVTLMVFYVFAMQCASTVAVVRRETNSWRWPLFQWLYMGALAWILAFITWQGGHWLGWG